ncbi:Wadjet anti-phage system protein JetA family protein [Sulfurovum mangrovi]|uniref:Wadjet anti-phage system protein JetA family protein n=1 Tax=Sulfurovum mangrovi TaxID=2893889 RepID=UPI001E529E09|nr:Wadjet anti-phage system protein JetA family protein [Sulfurovum mangrovi]UFH60384.1 DUF5716 family protein [Sulfurovum mangrovi]
MAKVKTTTKTSSMITEQNSDFFNILTGKNASFYEKLLMTFYEEIYKGSVGEVTSNKAYLKSMIIRVQRDFDTDEENKNFSVILNRLEETGWIESKFDNLLIEYIYNFTRIGRKVAQSLYQLNNKDTITRHRNVRTTLGLLESYKRDGDPYDLVDALETSDYIVSDLMDQINEIHEARKKMIHDATQNVEQAGENFIEYIEKDFKSSITVYFNEDSISEHANRINEVINDILDDAETLQARNRRMVERYPTLTEDEYPVETQLITISDRVKNAKDNRMPELIESIKSLFKFSEMVLKQVSSLMIKRSSHMNTLALQIKDSDENEQEKILDAITKKISVSRSRYLDPYKIKVRNITKKRVKNNNATITRQPTHEEQIEHKIKTAIRESRAYLSADVQKRIIETLKEEDSIINGLIPIDTYKDLSFAINVVSVASTSGMFEVIKTGSISKNKYFTTDEYIINKKD